MREKLNAMLGWLREALRSRYVARLEEDAAALRAEVERLRAENRALLNSLLGTAGIPPIEPGEPRPLREIPRVRRRSWPQVQLAREAEAARGNQGIGK